MNQGDYPINEDLWRVVISVEEHYSIWPLYKEVPLGWKADGMEGTKSECLNYIEKAWVDMRPKSLREQLQKELE